MSMCNLYDLQAKSRTENEISMSSNCFTKNPSYPVQARSLAIDRFQELEEEELHLLYLL